MSASTISVDDLPDLDRLALVLVDLQRGFDDVAFWGPRNNAECEANVARLLAEWRTKARPVVFVRHDSNDPASPLSPTNDGNRFTDALAGEPDLLVSKHVNSAFHGSPDLHAWLGEQGLGGIVVAGITTNHCCETTARVGGNLGYEVVFVLDATCTFDRAAPDGQIVTADELARTTATNLHGEFATVVTTSHLIG